MVLVATYLYNAPAAQRGNFGTENGTTSQPPPIISDVKQPARSSGPGNGGRRWM